MPALACSVLVTAVLLSLGVPPDGHAAPVRTLEEFGGRADDGLDDTVAFRSALAALVPGDRLALGPGTYQHDDVLRVDVPGVTVTGRGTTVLATREERSAFHVAASDVTLDGLRFGISSTTRRWYAYEQMKVRVSASSGVALRGVVVDGAAAAGIYVGNGARDFRIERPVVRGTRADGIHITGGATGGTVDRPVTEATGDDGIAVVSYESDREPCRSITVLSPTVLGTTWGRGISVVGGEGIRYTDVRVEDTDAAGVYIAVEPEPHLTLPVRDVQVSGGVVSRANRNGDIDHGAVVVYLGRRPSGMSDVRVEGLRIEDTRPTAPSAVTVRSVGGPPRFLTFADLQFTGEGPPERFGGDVDRRLYSVID